jgi:nucleoid DNA-binding protein
MDIPFMGKSERGAPLAACIKRAAKMMHVSEYHAACLMSFFFEEVVEQTCRCRVVRVPGFGIFAPKSWYPRKPDVPPRAYPAFSAAIGYRVQMAAQCPVSNSRGLLAIERHRKNSFDLNQRGKSRRRARTTQQAFRRNVRAEGRRMGYEFDDEAHDRTSPD